MEGQPQYMVPQTWFEKWASRWDPARYELVPQIFGNSQAINAAAALTPIQIQVPEPIYVFELGSKAWVTATGVSPTWPYRIGFRVSNDDWTNGRWNSELVTGDGSRAATAAWNARREWRFPRLVQQNQIVIVEIDNSITGNAAMTVDVVVAGYIVRELQQTR